MAKNLFDKIGQLESLKKNEVCNDYEVLFNCHIPKSLRENLKIKSAKEGVSMKELVINALKGFYTDL
ncbi:hypothetical protein MYRA21_2532 [Myroides sp. A21]|uniref:hypothetical protein n=1 Tax=Myroides sp. A21 TaxID=1583100 RepID=UPI00057FD4DC|nr:hypothetical protein [Myroides sp. A21]AJA69644.1 hypothetical protein MYRA21_2532 [Myroides sp. A21]